MAFTIPATLLFLAGTAVLIRQRRVGAGAALVCLLAGFFLASTGIAPTIRHAVTAVGHGISSIHF